MLGIGKFYREKGRAEELGSGYRNCERYKRLYTNGYVSIFDVPVIDRSDLTTDPAIDLAIDPATDPAIDPAIDPANGYANEGRRKPDYLKLTDLGSESTIKRYLDQLREVGFIEFKGTAPQTGGYFIKDKLKKISNK